jgi:hypothetical protein
MGQLAGEIELPEYPKRQPDFAPIMPLVSYLDSLPDNGTERALNWGEDQQAIGILRSLVPENNRAGQECVAEFTHQSYRKGRTLAGWYMMARHMLAHFDSGNCCHCE